MKQGIRSSIKKGVLFFSASMISTSAISQKAFDEYLIDKTFETPVSYSDVLAPSEGADASVTINANTQVAEIRQSLFGQNAVGYQGNRLPASAQEKNWKNGNFSLLRYPGGNWSNKWFWDGNVPGAIKTSTTVGIGDLLDGQSGWMLGVDEYPQFIEDMGADGIVCVNAGYALYGNSADPVETAAQYAADWVDYYNNTLNAGIKYWEIGNENYGPWQAGFDLGTPEQYGQICVRYAELMKQKDPSIKIGVVLYEGRGGFNDSPQGKDWNEKVMPITQHIADFYIIHHYPHPNSNQDQISEAEIYDAVDVVKETHDWMNEFTETYTDYEPGHFPIAMTEFNARAGLRNISRTNTLFTTLMLCEYAKYDYEAATQWDLVNGFTVETGDHGLVSRRDPFLETGSVNPEFYAFYYLNKYFGDKMVASTSSNPDIISYSTTFSSGELGLVIVNRGNVDQTVEVNINDFALGGRAYWHTVYGDESDFDRTVYVNGVGPGTTFTPGVTYTSNYGSNERSQVATEFEANGVSGPQNYDEIDPYSMVVSSGVGTKFNTSRYSVTYIVFEAVDGDCAIPNAGPDQSLCGKSELILDAGTAEADSYVWYDENENVKSNTQAVSVSETGVYTVEVTKGTCTLLDEIVVTDLIQSFDLGEDKEFCVETSFELNSGITDVDLDYVWLRDGVAIPADTGSLTVFTPGEYELTVTATGCQPVSDQVIITSLLPNVAGDTVCMGGEQVMLEVLTSGNYSWYDLPQGGQEVETGTIYMTVIDESSVFYVQDENTSMQLLGKPDQDGAVWGNTASGVYEQSDRKLTVTVEQTLILESFDVFVNTNGTDVVFNITQIDGSFSDSWNFSGLSNTRQTLDVNVILEPGEYTFDFIGTVGGIWFQNNTPGQNSFPGLLSFVPEPNWASNYYGMMYDWVVTTGSGCSRTPVHAVIDENHLDCVVSNNEILQETRLIIYPNPTDGMLHFSESIQFEVMTTGGKALLKGKGMEVDLSVFDPGVYLLKAGWQVLKVVKE